MEDADSTSISRQVPPGFRFHPTEEELVQYYLTKKIAFQRIDLDVIPDVDLNKLEPWDIQEKCKIGSTPQNDWYFFSHKDKKYPTGTRTNRATAAGFWKATGRDKAIYSNSQRIGMRKTLVFYKGRAPHGQKSDWIMHEYRLAHDHHLHMITTNAIFDHSIINNHNACSTNINGTGGEATLEQEEGWVICRIFKKKIHHKTFDSPISMSSSTGGLHMRSNDDEEAQDQLEQILHEYNNIMAAGELIGGNYLQKPFPRRPIYNRVAGDGFLKLNGNPDSPNSLTNAWASAVSDNSEVSHVTTGLNDLDLLVANISKTDPDPESWFMGDQDQDQQLRRLSPSSFNVEAPHYHNECELWSFGRPSLSATDLLGHTSNVPV